MNAAFFYVLLKRTQQRSLRSFTFFWKERSVLCVLLCSFEKNAAFFAFFYVLLKRTQRSLRSFTFFRKERKRTQRFFGFHKSPKTLKKESKRTLRYLNERKRMMRSERKRMMHSERKRTRSPTLRIITVRGPDLHCTPLPHMESEALTAQRSSPSCHWLRGDDLRAVIDSAETIMANLTNISAQSMTARRWTRSGQWLRGDDLRAVNDSAESYMTTRSHTGFTCQGMGAFKDLLR